MSPNVEPHNIHNLRPDPEKGRSLIVSVVIPTYNRAAILTRTLESLASQNPDSPKFEIHVADDGSEEDIRSVVETVTGADIHYHRRERDRFGAGEAPNPA